MDDDSQKPALCKSGCGFFGNPVFDYMCSKCYKDHQKANQTQPGNSDAPAALTNTSPQTKETQDTAQPKQEPQQQKQQQQQQQQQRTLSPPAPPPSMVQINSNNNSSSSSSSRMVASPHVLEETLSTPASRKHSRSPSPIAEDRKPATAGTTPVSTPPSSSDRPVQTNKGRCFKCRVKVPLAKQTINKCRCNYVFCDSHRYPDRHDCEIDFGKLDRDTLAKNNPKLHERPKGGRSFQRIDSL
ncbi:hypothetical protein BCR43DRAFT_495516 [Syncephalastrum racemosum]|uniref:AN1-type domain-containing protein n=1 Tax=Syncephalastrum racemosum TaxID=13706 RepID=A0A1X2H5Z7_SYNRA|nr:hypothetical protein BCR43DRAFT_495516 [Syncephalastrum racemosum]